ncbi:MAG: hypothetical protein UU67_C0084G0003 [Candidatus Daviesbacteria bacterium GW2011_GWB1_41_5]|uniref:Uncharacterized protein n=1 Tax=Candidatus Daviesbacteria bacterium GW2011_GWB1_41_5 TaxID=1618429 RepID=A0A0G0YND3_9BACT|nr:MAG: hypothetical protein UU67_C0084G0003 [Candidatus Daviesbacteria bacterium GW2011_GWB1_41_5]
MQHKRRAQEEIVGFVLIVVLVVIVLVIFLGISLRNPKPQQRESEIIYQFLESSMEQTTNCSLSEGASYLPLDDALRECHETGSSCADGMSSCDSSEDTLKKILNNSFAVGPAYPYKGYDISAVYVVNASGQQQVEPVLNITAGNCSNSYSGNSYWIPSFPGSIIVSAKLCG